MNANLPLSSLHTFIKVCQYGSIKASAQALNVTSGAISQQIRQLEERLGVVLFIREHGGMRQTAISKEIYPSLNQAFEQIRGTLDTLNKTKAQKRITISTVPSFAAAWLVPRLKKFNELYPDIEVRVEATPTLVDFRRDQVDIALRHGLGNYPGLKTIRLMAPILLPVVSPELLAQYGPVNTPADCLKYPLLQDSDRADWKLWLKAHGIENDSRIERGASFAYDFLLVRAVESGQGMALLQDIYVQEALDSGRLILALDKPWPSRFAYYAVMPTDVVSQPEVKAFINWIIEESSESSHV